MSGLNAEANTDYDEVDGYLIWQAKINSVCANLFHAINYAWNCPICQAAHFNLTNSFTRINSSVICHPRAFYVYGIFLS